ncbi:MAG: hypothetical protein HYT72_03765 [Candidatus Aenigmarchaeota archaeon]|nr:hypothetical protein [Candidatus Aenigmarchaeota archaeon]
MKRKNPKREYLWLKNFHNLTAFLILVSTVLEWNILMPFKFFFLLNMASVSLLLIFAFFAKEQGVQASTVPLAVFLIASFGVLGVPEHLANNQLSEAVVDGLVALFQLAAAGISLLLLKSR